jgi:hypothetical protein
MQGEDTYNINEKLFEKFDNVRPGAIAKLIKDNDKQDERLISTLKVIEPLKSTILDEIDAEFYKTLVLKSEFKYAETWKGAVIVLEKVLRKRGLMAGGKKNRTRRNRTQRNSRRNNRRQNQ